MNFLLKVTTESYDVRVTHYRPACAMRISGTGMGDADPPEEEEFEFDLFFLGEPVDDDHIIALAEPLALAEYKRLTNRR